MKSLVQVRISSECHQRASALLRYASASYAGFLGIVNAYNVLRIDRRGVQWDERKEKFRLKGWDYETSISEISCRERVYKFVQRRRDLLFKAFSSRM